MCLKGLAASLINSLNSSDFRLTSSSTLDEWQEKSISVLCEFQFPLAKQRHTIKGNDKKPNDFLILYFIMLLFVNSLSTIEWFSKKIIRT